jgi:hypothetical protein
LVLLPFFADSTDKYTQVARILSPIVLTIRHIEKMMLSPKLSVYIRESFQSPEKLKKDILFDFFRYAFDGSGADNFYDAGCARVFLGLLQGHASMDG